MDFVKFSKLSHVKKYNNLLRHKLKSQKNQLFSQVSPQIVLTGQQKSKNKFNGLYSLIL